MSAALPLPRPGVLLGSYPQRHAGDAPAWWRWWQRQGTLRAALAAPEALRRWRQRRFVAAVHAAQAALADADAPALAARAPALRARLAREGFGDAVLADALALVGETAARTLGRRPFDSQLIAARIQLGGRLAEMATGEGKTLAAALAAAAAALAGVPVHVVTSNDYLVARDAQALRPLYEALGMRVGAVTAAMRPSARAAAWRCDVTYCTGPELVFDHLRDRLRAEAGGLDRAGELQRRAAALAQPAADAPLLPGLCMALIDEADSVLLDDAMTPLVLSRAGLDADARRFARQALRVAGLLRARRDFRLEQATGGARLTDLGRAAVGEHGARFGGRWTAHPREAAEQVELALAARHCFERDRHYLVRDGRIALIDETTGRVAEGRVWSRGLQALVELKEGCEPSGTPHTLAQATYQRFFPRYLRLGGMSGTLTEARAELLGTYGLAVERVPLRRPSRRRQAPTRLYADDARRWADVVQALRGLQREGRPVLVGTDSVADSERLAQRLQAAGLVHTVLNARQDAHEAAVVAEAGAAGRITVATNMAGRGTDIPLCDAAAAAGGLHVMACQLNGSPRIDRQLAGRAGRQGQPGSVQRWLSLDAPLWAEAPLLRRFAAAWVAARGGCVEGWSAAALAAALQHVVEGRRVRARAALRGHDEAMDERLGAFGLRE